VAKDLPYFKFSVSEWNDGDVTLCSLEAQGLFINLCSLYWSQEGQLSYTKAKRRYYQCNTTVWDELVNDGIIKLSGDAIIITFLDEQFAEREKLSVQNKKNVEKRWKNADSDTTVLPSNNDGTVPVYNIEERRGEEKREEEKRGEKKREDDLFENEIFGLKKESRITIKKVYAGDKIKIIYDLRAYFDASGQLEDIARAGWTDFDEFMAANPAGVFDDDRHLYNSYRKFCTTSNGKKKPAFNLDEI
jgi:hypothetical protein